MPEGRREMTVRVRLTRSGFPTIIPTFHRRIIERRDDRADRWVRIYLSWFTVGRIVELAKPVTRDLFASITEDAPGPEEVIESVLYLAISLDGRTEVATIKNIKKTHTS